MVRMFKLLCGLVMLALGVEHAAAFSLLRPFEPYQVQVITYQVGGDLGGPAQFDDAYRHNMPVLYYTYDPDFLGYFGSNGVVAIDEAFAIMNSLSNVSSYSSDLSEFPLEAQSYNFRALALNLLDLKSVALNLLVEQTGLAEPDRYTWTLHDRLLANGVPCPVAAQYLVIKRNFDPVYSPLDQLQASSYVNGTLYSYFIQEFCQGTPFLADAVEFPVDPLANTFTAVAANNFQWGAYYTGLTRDDVGGMRWMLRTNYLKTEAAGAGTLTYITNTAQQLLFTSNLTQFAELALTNGPAALSALFPDLQIASSVPIFTNVVTTNVIFFFTNDPFLPPGTPTLASATVRTTNVLTYFSHQFLNVFITPGVQLVSNTNIPVVPGHSATNGIIYVLTTNISTTACGATQPWGTICSNVTVTPVATTANFGDYYILSTNFCGVSIVSTQLIVATTVTNATFVATNAPGTSNLVGETFSQTPLYYFNQYIYVVQPVVCPTNSIALRQGIERVQYIRRDFDSLLTRFFYPVTNDYILNSITNSTLFPQKIRRVVTTPDILIDAADFSTTPADNIIGVGSAARNINFRTNTVSFGGTLETGIVFTFNRVGPTYLAINPFNLDEASQIPLYTWGSFNGSTNPPTVYGNGTSLISLENQVLIQISPNTVALPNGQVGVNYTNAFSGFTAIGGSPPYTWTISPGTAALPPGLTLSATGQISGVPSAVSPNAITYDIIIRLTDIGARFVDRPYAITITP